MNGQIRSELRGVERNENYTYEHPDEGDYACQWLAWRLLCLCQESRCRPVHRVKYARVVLFGRNDAVLVSAFKEADEMGRDQPEQYSDPKPQESCFCQQQT